METQAYNVRTDWFDGPLDLLLHLIKKKKMQIQDVVISEITGDYIQYLNANTGINPSREGEFLSMASTLIYIKSRSLIPRPKEAEEVSPEEELIHTLIEYDKIQKISLILKKMENAEAVMWRRDFSLQADQFDNTEFEIEDVTTFQLAEVFMNIVNRMNQEEVFQIESKNYSIKEKLAAIMKILEQEDFLDFSQYMDRMKSIEEKLVSFFTLLEMVKQKLVTAIQKQLFDQISVWKTANTEPEPEV